MDDGGAGIYRQFAREEARDRGRLAVGWVVAGVVHLLLLLAPLPWGNEAPAVAMPPVRGEAFELTTLAFAPPRPPAPSPLPTEAPEEPAEPEPPARAQAEILVPAGPAAGLVPPRPLHTPTPRSPEAAWRAGLGAEVRLTLVVDIRGEVAEVTVEEVRALAATGRAQGSSRDDGAEPLPHTTGQATPAAPPELSAAQKDLFGRVAAEAAREWRFDPATLAGNPITLGIGVRVVFPAPEPGTEEPGGQV